jgi:hypothetical protein
MKLQNILKYIEMIKTISMNEEHLRFCLDLPNLQGAGN